MAPKGNGLPFYVRSSGLLVADTACLVGGIYLAFAWHYGFPLENIHHRDFLRAYLILLPLRVFLYSLLGLYRTDLEETILDLLYRVFWVCLLITGLEFLFLLGIRNYYLPEMGVSRKLAVALGGGWLLSATAVRALIGGWRRRLRADRSRVLIVASGDMESVLFQEIEEFIELGHSVVGFVGDDLHLPSERYSVLGRIERLPQLLEEHSVTQVVVVDDRMPRKRVSWLLGLCEARGISVRILPSLYEVMIGRIHITRAGGIPLVDVATEPLTPLERVLKRAMDVVVALVVFLAVFWVWILICFLIWLDQRGPVLERLPCIGRGGKRFHLLRFRIAANRIGSQGKQASPSEPVDPLNLTPIGDLLQRLDFDRIPQLLNVIAGDLSLIGPRPMTPDFFERIIEQEPLYRHCLTVKPGVTGLAQIHGQSHHLASKLRYDLSYINNCSFLLDLKILFQTFSVLITGRKIKA